MRGDRTQKFFAEIKANQLIVYNLTNGLLENCQVSLQNCYAHYVGFNSTVFQPKEIKYFDISKNNFWENYKDQSFTCKITQYGRWLFQGDVGDKKNLGHWVLFSNSHFSDLTKELIIGLTRYSTRPILHYTYNYDFGYQCPRLTNIRFDGEYKEGKPERIQLLKPSVLLKALSYGIGRGIFLDSDIQVRSNIDNLFLGFNNTTSDLVFQKNFWDYTLLNSQYIPGPLVREYFGIKDITNFKQPYPQGITNCLCFNQNHLNLFEEWARICNDPKIPLIREEEFLHDELLLNCLLWNKGISPKFLNQGLNINSIKDVRFFYNYNNPENLEYIDLNKLDLGCLAQSYLPYNKEEIKFFHCIKDQKVATQINNLILEKETNSHPNEESFKTQLLNFYNNITVNTNRINQDKLKQKKENQEKGKVNINFINGAFFEILDGPDLDYQVNFIDKKNKELVYETTLKPNHWCRTARRYFTDYNIQVKNNSKTVYNYDLNLKNKRVYVALDSKSLGDTIAWFPYVEEFRQQHGCEMVCSTFHNFLFQSEYPNITFVNPGEVVHNLFAMYEIGCFNIKERIYSPGPHNEKPLQKVASELLGLEFKEIRPKIVKQPNIKLSDKKYICIAPESTAQCKFWNNPNGWTELVKYLKSKNYEVFNINEKGTEIKGTRSIQGSLKEVIGVLQGCEFGIFLPSGLAWLSWALNKRVVLISGFSYPWVEFQSNCIRISPKEGICQGCYSTPGQPLDPGDWFFCVYHKGTDRHFECTKTIEASDVISKIEQSKLLT